MCEIQGSDPEKGPQKPSLSILKNGCPFYFFPSFTSAVSGSLPPWLVRNGGRPGSLETELYHKPI